VTPAGGTISLLVGAVLLRLTLTGTYERYVRAGMDKWLLVAGVAVIAVGTLTLARALRHERPVDIHEDHDHSHGLGVGWLLLTPIAALLLVAPPTLGAYGVDRGTIVDVSEGAPVFAHLPRSSKPRPMTLLEFGQRAFDHNGASFRRTPVQLTGFVADAEKGGFRLARYQIACCAADAVPVVVQVAGTSGDPPPVDQWVTVTGTFQTVDGELPEIAATSVAEITAPEDPYE
jgi:uncharacterized repeat protein (TIGR03943 family)